MKDMGSSWENLTTQLGLKGLKVPVAFVLSVVNLSFLNFRHIAVAQSLPWLPLVV